MTRKERLIKKLDEWKKFLKEDEAGYSKDVAKKSTTELEMEYYAFKLAIEENVNNLDASYNDYINNDIDNISLNYRVTDEKICVEHWQNMQEIVVKELLKRAA